MLTYEKDNCTNYNLIAGIDEAGRGPLAGPVAVAVVIMPMDNMIEGVNDSKKLSEKKRESLYEQIITTALDYHIEFIDNNKIDKLNILEATKLGMQKCVSALKIRPDCVLIDAVKLPLDVPTISIIHGDALAYNIACASILAKVARDRLMLEYDKEYPEYQFAKHKGYGTKLHIQNLKEYGKCPIHRNSFIGHFIDVNGK